MIEQLRPGLFVERADPVVGSAGEGLCLEHHADQRLERVRSAWHLAVSGFALAMMLHGAVALALVWQRGETLGGHGTDLEAISVEVALVSATALESRLTAREERAASAGTVDAVEGAAVETAAAPEAAATVAPSPEAVKSPDAPPPLERLTVEPDGAPPDAEAPIVEPQREQVVTGAPKAPELPPETRLEPQKDTVVEPRPATAKAADDSRLSLAQPVGGVASRADAGSGAARAAASAAPGEVKAFAKGVVEALGRTRPKGLKSGTKGTVKVAFAVSDDGKLDFVRVAASSGSAVLDEAAIGAVKRASFPAPPPGLSLSDRTYEVPYHFR